MKKGFILAAIIVAASMVFMSFNPMPVIKPDCRSSLNFPVAADKMYTSEQGASDAMYAYIFAMGGGASSYEVKQFPVGLQPNPSDPSQNRWYFVVCFDGVE